MRKFKSGDLICTSKDIKVIDKGKSIGKISKKKAYKVKTVKEFPEHYKLLELPEKYIIYVHHADLDEYATKL